jgi:hypothetical protein
VVTLADAFAAPTHALLEDDGRGSRAGHDVRYEGSIDLDLVEGKRLQRSGWPGGNSRPSPLEACQSFRRPIEIPGNEKPGREENVAAETVIASNQSFSASA